MKCAILLPLLIIALSGCAPSYVRNDAATLKDGELCSRLGYAKYTGDSSAFSEGLEELKARANGGVMSISPDECKSYSEMGASEARSLEQKSIAVTSALQQQNQIQQQQALQQQQAIQQSLPVTTNCMSGYNGSLSCTTY